MSAEPPQTVASLYSAHHGWLVGWLRARLGCSQQAADFAQDTFLRLLLSERRHGLPGDLREPRCFLGAVARRVMVDSFRRRALEQAYLQAFADAPPAFDISPEERLLLLESLHAVDAMLSGLGRKVKQAFLLSQLQGLGYKEIAARMGVSVSSVTKYVAKATEHCLLFALEQQG
ncbi:sigma-70 family RNA polymerase sigma factor [Pseudomonas japonica]|uniref:RNA polymerase sigma-70 factor, ECF subfamily n=1 Tax=Pseudomonas japonica TaxID=256466 RepID=A0A239EWT2_9PSED|nr:sigma-70 family RNA polymerase sigma factor [Pseudomonas japonica]SNS49220.1 RNA polymerase sigma-70 factor, ECF subfamily [Pseudomonas japonica]